jgi:glycosyltransferase involved in cell wall biosynthesis
LSGRAYLAETRAVRELLRSGAIQVIHTHGYRSDVIGGWAARRLGVPQVTTAHGFIGGTRRGRFYEWLQLRTARRAAAAVAVSGPIVERYATAGVPRERIHLIPNAWAGVAPLGKEGARAVLGIRPAGPLLGWVGRLSREKGADVFLEALGHIRDLRWEAAFIGEGGQRALLEARARELGLAGRVQWLGLVPDAGRAMAAFDGFVLSSRTEGTPVALLEAMAGAVPTVATAVGGVPDVISGREAWLVPSESPERLAGALRELLNSPVGALERGRAARERLLQERGAGPWLDRHEALYRSLLAPGRRA